MAIVLKEAREILKSGALYSGDSFSVRKLDDAIKYAYNRFNSETNAVTEILAVPATSNDEDLIDLSLETGLGDFHRDQVVMVYNYTDADAPVILEPLPFRSLLRKRKNSGATGNASPTHYAFPSDQNIYLHPQVDAAYNLKIIRRKPLFAFTSGSFGSWAVDDVYKKDHVVSDISGAYGGVTSTYRALIDHTAVAATNQPGVGSATATTWEHLGTTATYPVAAASTQTFTMTDEWLHRVLYTGARYAVTMGMPGQPEWEEAKRDFDSLIAEGKSRFVDSTPGLMDRQSAPTARS